MKVCVNIVCFSVLICVRLDIVLNHVSVCTCGQKLGSCDCVYVWIGFGIM